MFVCETLLTTRVVEKTITVLAVPERKSPRKIYRPSRNDDIKRTKCDQTKSYLKLFGGPNGFDLMQEIELT